MSIDAPQFVHGGSVPPRAGVFKRSLVVAGHRTSISLEDAFWRGLQDLAKQRSQSINALVAEIDAGRGRVNLSSAIRLFVLASAIQ
jgi:predicted DNA-binding ribbon-helix-helix protein